MNSKTTGAELRSVLHDVPVGIVIFRGPDFVVEIANKVYLEIIDRKEEDFVGKPLFEGLPEVKERVEPLLKARLAVRSNYSTVTLLARFLG